MGSEAATEQLKVSEVVRKVQQAICDSATRAELEAAVCEAFADSDPYVFAWIGEHDPETNAVVSRASAGIEDGYLDEISISVEDPSGPRGPTAKAVRTGAIQTMQHIRSDPEYEPWRAQALDRGYESSAAAPIANDDQQYGVLNVYSDRAAAFDESEARLLSELGETIATAIDRIETRAELRSSKQKYETLTERISDAYYAVDADWEITYWNEQMAERTGRSASAMCGEVVWEAFPELLGTTAETQYRDAMASQESRSFEQYVEAPYDYWVEVDVYPDADGLSIFSRDVTDRMAHEQELKETRNMLQEMIESAPDPIVMLDENRRVTLWNPGAERVFGWSEAEIVGERAPFVPDERGTEFETFVTNLDRGESNLFVDTVRRTKDGERIDVSLSSTRVEADGELIGYLGIFKDIGERKQYEQELEEHRDSLEVLNQVVRHDIRNDLQVILAYSEVLAEQVDDELLEYVDHVLASTETAIELTHSAGDLAEVLSQAEAECRPLPVRSALETQLEEVRAINRAASITVDGQIPDVTVSANEMLSSVFRNVLKNAIQHNDKPVPTVTVSVSDEADHVAVAIADNGPGIPDERKAEMFGKANKGLESEGTGLGLYLVDQLVAEYGGDVRLEDNEPDGTVVVVDLPKAE